MTNNESLKAVLFDLDGTLLNSIDDLADSMNAWLAQQGFPQHHTDAYRYFIGDGAKNLARRSLPEDRRDEDTVTACMTGMREVYAARCTLKTRPYQGVPEMLDQLAARRVPMAIFSNKPDRETRLLADKLLGRWRFDAVAGAREGAPVKPDPAGALRIADRLGVEPGRFLYLGDTNTDMRTALAAGMYPVGAAWGYRTAEELTESGARVLCKHPRDVSALLGTNT